MSVAADNDLFRREGHFFLTTGVQALGPEAVAEVLRMVQDFNAFTQDNDPHKEHDFGSFIYSGHKIFWKIDYYDRSLQYFHDPRDPGCRRVLTVLLAEEY